MAIVHLYHFKVVDYKSINNRHTSPSQTAGIHVYQFIIAPDSGWRSCRGCTNDRTTKNGVQSARALQYDWLCNGVYFLIKHVSPLSCKFHGKLKAGGEQGIRNSLVAPA